MSKLVSHKEYLLVEVSAELIDKIKVKGNKMYYGTHRFGYFHQWLPEGQYQKIGGGHQLNDSDWEGMVECTQPKVRGARVQMAFYKHYGNQHQSYPSPTTSGFSLLASHGLKKETTLILKKQ